MFGRIRNRRAQSTAEYAVLLGLVVGVIITMQTYVKRGWQARVKAETDNMFDGITTSNQWTGNTGVTAAKKQYEPTALSRLSTDKVTADTDTLGMSTGGATTKTFTRTSSQEKGDYQQYDFDRTGVSR